MTEHARRFDAINLGQGFPDFDGPDEIKEAAVRAIRDESNQYAPMSGEPRLRQAVADHQLRFYDMEHTLDEVIVTNGATEGIFVSLQALCEAGDEVITFEPFYDSYRAAIAMAGAVGRCYTLQDPEFTVDAERLQALVSDKTRAILLNTPHNPTGKVFSRAELEVVADIAREHDLLVISDEVYEHLVFDGAEHVPIASLPDMRDRTVTISSAGKTFSFTGWKIGWLVASPELVAAIRTAHQFVTFCAARPLQVAIADALALGDDFYDGFRADYRERRDLLIGGLESVGFEVRRPAGTYFALTDIRPLGFDDDVDFCHRLPELVQVAAIPPTAFYVDKAAGRHLARFAFCKTRPVLEEGVRRLGGLREALARREESAS
ncbi:MAG: aminotransferase class I/II-fold pyridoxal phosphate-dependent enzyme [Acidobacteriota bacterium]